MVHRPSDSRLLNSLLSNEKEYHKQLLVLLDNYSQQSLGAFAAYASASPAHVARAIIAVAGSFAGADDALRRYAVSIEAWQAELCALKDLEEDVGSIVRDREILFVRLFFMRLHFFSPSSLMTVWVSVTRLIKLSKNQKPTRDSFIGTLGSPVGEMSQTSLSSFSVTSAGPSSSKLSAAQGELQACEAHLAAKEKELDERRISVVRRGLEARCKAMVECGWNWGEMGKEGLRALEGIDGFGSASNGTDG
jgi:DNA-binding PucR family transcriptional regulator